MAPSAHATVLSPGDGPIASSDVTVPGTAVLVADQTVTGWSGLTLTPSGLIVSVVEDVYRETNGNIDFTYTVTNNSTTSSGHKVDTVTVGNFGAAPGTINVGGSGLTTASTAPVQVSWSQDASTVKWFYSQGSPSINHDIPTGGATGQTLVILTSAKNYENIGSLTVQNSGTVQLAGYQPGPEPSTMALAGLGALGLIGYGLRRRKVLGA
jgi:hypothetical protein